MATKRKPKQKPKITNGCKNLLELFDNIERIHQEMFEDVQKALKIHNDEAAIKRILYGLKDKLS